MSVSREKRRGKFFWVARERGRIQASIKIKGSGLNKQSASELFRNNGTFKIDRQRTSSLLNNVREKSIMSKFDVSQQRLDSALLFAPRRRNIQVVITATIGKQVISGRSMQIPFTDRKSRKDAIKEAMRNLAERVDGRINQGIMEGDYIPDVEAGMRTIAQRGRLRIGWVYYVPK